MDWHLVRRWATENKMPTFRRLMEEGSQAELSTISDRLPDSVWNCICSGLNPAHLARYFHVQQDPETAGLRYMPDGSSGVNYFWDHLSAAGPGIPRGATISDASIFDFVPTILYAAGMRAPTTCEGRPLFPALCAIPT
jgi:predicted AlkP superfamily phosphohydrolase/phosphomutase